MQERTLNNLILENEDYIFAGNLTINGDVNIKNGSLIVSGTLTFVSDDLSTVSITGGNIDAESLVAKNVSIDIMDGDIYVSKDLDCRLTQSFYTDGDIKVGGNAAVAYVQCLNYLVEGDSVYAQIFARQDVYIGGNVDSGSLKARDFLVLGHIRLNLSTVIVQNFYCSGKVMDGEVTIIK